MAERAKYRTDRTVPGHPRHRRLKFCHLKMSSLDDSLYRSSHRAHCQDQNAKVPAILRSCPCVYHANVGDYPSKELKPARFHMPMSDRLTAAMQRSIGGLLDGQSGDAIRIALRPVLERAFRDGVQVGMQLSSSLSQSAIEDAIVRLTETDRPTRRTLSPSHSRRHRAISGAVGQAIELVLQERPVLRIIEIQQQAKSLDPTISGASVTNELRRKKNSRYRQEGKRWFLIGDTTKEEVEDRSFFAAETESPVGGSGRAAA
jgi:hypothetical protein